MITITVTQDNKTLTITHPLGIPLTPDNDSWYSLKKTIELMLIFIGYDSKAANDLMPDCEECDVVTELNREHNAELSAQCERCEYKRDSVNEGVKRCYTCQRDGESEECYTCTPDYINWKPKKSVKLNMDEGVFEGVNDGVSDGVKNCSTCFHDSRGDDACYSCRCHDTLGRIVRYYNWKPKEPPIITEEVEKDTGKDCENCEYFDNKDFEHPCDVCVCFDGEGKAIVPTHWQPISVKTSNDETTGKSEIKGWINRDIEL
jgi:hypothetical protein